MWPSLSSFLIYVMNHTNSHKKESYGHRLQYYYYYFILCVLSIYCIQFMNRQFVTAIVLSDTTFASIHLITPKLKSSLQCQTDSTCRKLFHLTYTFSDRWQAFRVPAVSLLELVSSGQTNSRFYLAPVTQFSAISNLLLASHVPRYPPPPCQCSTLRYLHRIRFHANINAYYSTLYHR